MIFHHDNWLEIYKQVEIVYSSNCANVLLDPEENETNFVSTHHNCRKWAGGACILKIAVRIHGHRGDVVESLLLRYNVHIAANHL